MDEACYAALGRKQLELEQLHVEYDRLLVLLDEVVAGRMARMQIEVDLERRSWAIKPRGMYDDEASSIPMNANGV